MLLSLGLLHVCTLNRAFPFRLKSNSDKNSPTILRIIQGVPMLKISLPRISFCAVLTIMFITCSALPAAAILDDLFGKKEIDEKERAETIERIENIQDKLKLLQEKLRALERRKSYREAAEKAEELGSADLPNVQVNWSAVDEATINPGEAGVYTYLLFKGDLSNTSAVGALEDFILTIETLPANNSPAAQSNLFVLPVEEQQSSVSLGRRPYDFDLNKAYLRRFNLDDAPDGPILVSVAKAIDPYGADELPALLAVGFGSQEPYRTLELAEAWHKYQSKEPSTGIESVSMLFWELIDGAGPTTVSRNQQKIQVTLPQP